MKKAIFLILIFSFLLSGCQMSNVLINYEGKSENWYVFYKIAGNEQSHDSYCTFKYIGTKDKPEGTVDYKIDGPKEGEGGDLSLDYKNEFTNKMALTGGLPKETDRDIRVTLEWNGKSEMLMLKRAK